MNSLKLLLLCLCLLLQSYYERLQEITRAEMQELEEEEQQQLGSTDDTTASLALQYNPTALQPAGATTSKPAGAAAAPAGRTSEDRDAAKLKPAGAAAAGAGCRSRRSAGGGRARRPSAIPVRCQASSWGESTADRAESTVQTENLKRASNDFWRRSKLPLSAFLRLTGHRMRFLVAFSEMSLFSTVENNDRGPRKLEGRPAIASGPM